MNYKIATMSEGYSFYWLNSSGKTSTIYANGAIFGISKLLKIVNDNPQYLFKLGCDNNKIEITQIDDDGKVIKYLQREDFEIKVSIKA